MRNYTNSNALIGPPGFSSISSIAMFWKRKSDNEH